MAFEELKDQAERVQEESRAYIDSTIGYYKLWGFKVAMKSMSMAAKVILVMVCLAMVLLFGSVAAALAIGEALDSLAVGFLIAGGVFLILLVLIVTFKDKIVEGPMIRKYSEIFFNEE
jgi:hypothetical protein